MDECDYVALFGLRHLELRQGRGGVSEKHVPVALTDLHAPVSHQHFSAPVVHGCTRALAQEITCHGVGKTFTLALAALWWLVRWADGIVLTAAPIFRQVGTQLWSEIHRAAAR